MGRIVGLSRAIKQEWLVKTVELFLQGNDEATIKSKLNEYLSFEIESPTNLRKTREILMNIWMRPAVLAPDIHLEAVRAYRSDQSDKAALNWVMLLLAYPVFSDVCSLIGKISVIQGTFTPAWLKEKISDVWGERSTLAFSCNKIIQTLKNLEAIENEKPGVYRIKKRRISDEHTISTMLMSLLALGKKAYYEIPELSCVPLFFPFQYNVSLEWLHNSPKFTLGYFGGKMMLYTTK